MALSSATILKYVFLRNKDLWDGSQNANDKQQMPNPAKLCTHIINKLPLPSAIKQCQLVPLAKLTVNITI